MLTKTNAFSLVVVLIAAVVMACSSSMCGNDVALELKSPDGMYKAVVFERDCGATTDFSTQVSVMKSSRRLRDESGNVFTADSDHGAVPVNNKGLLAIDVRWLNNNTLEIVYPAKARVFSHESKVGDIGIQYSAR